MRTDSTVAMTEGILEVKKARLDDTERILNAIKSVLDATESNLHTANALLDEVETMPDDSLSISTRSERAVVVVQRMPRVKTTVRSVPSTTRSVPSTPVFVSSRTGFVVVNRAPSR